MLIYAVAGTTILFGALAFFFFQRAQALQNILSRGAKQYDDLQKDIEFVRGRLSAAEASNIGLEKELKLVKSVHESETARNAKIVSEFLNVQTSLERKLSNAELQRDHILTRFETLQDEREAIDADLKAKSDRINELESEREQLRRDLDDAVRRANAKFKTENDELRRRIITLEKETSELAAKEVDPKELEKLRRRANHNEQLYQSMKSLRDMADERNRNWERALRSLATWILSSSPLAQSNDPILSQPIGPLVGEALERIGGSLIDDDDDELELPTDDSSLLAATTTAAEP